MRTIAIINQKGGCGKTTVSINLAATLAAMGQKTLLVDMDPQSHCALGLAVPEAQIDRSTADLLRAGMSGEIGVADITWQISRNLDLAPSTVSLAAVEPQLATASDRDRRLAQVLATCADRYDYCIIDCPPSIGLLTFNALRAADEVIVPVETGYFAMQGSFRQEQTIEMLAQKVGHRVRFKILPTLYDVRTKLAREILSELKKHFGDKLLPLVINFNAKLKEAASFGQPITEYDAGSRGMKDFEELATWLQHNVPQHGQPLVAQHADPADVHANAAPQPQANGQANGFANGRAGSHAPAQPQSTAPPSVQPPSNNPALSRAAELVERARELSTRTAAISQRLHRQTEEQNIGQPIPPRLVEDPAPTPSNTTTAAPATPMTAPTPLRPTAAVQPAPERPGLAAKLEKIYGIKHTADGVLFVQPGEAANRVGIAGDFNNWNPASTPMRRNEQLGVWQACIKIPAGRYRYRLVVDGQWVQDPHNPLTETNPFGELNNVVEVD
ncbi:AAA family ATPase [Phycisphaeraceae bacterium D3-23]